MSIAKKKHANRSEQESRAGMELLLPKWLSMLAAKLLWFPPCLLPAIKSTVLYVELFARGKNVNGHALLAELNCKCRMKQCHTKYFNYYLFIYDLIPHSWWLLYLNFLKLFRADIKWWKIWMNELCNFAINNNLKLCEKKVWISNRIKLSIGSNFEYLCNFKWCTIDTCWTIKEWLAN